MTLASRQVVATGDLGLRDIERCACDVEAPQAFLMAIDAVARHAAGALTFRDTSACARYVVSSRCLSHTPFTDDAPAR